MTEKSGRRRRWLRYTLFGLLGVIVLAGGGLYLAYLNAPVSIAFAQGSGDLSDITLPEGFEIAYFAREITGARSMKLSEDGTLFVGSRPAGVVYAIPNAANSVQAESIVTIASGLRSPNGVDIIDGDLYVAEIGRILRYDDIDANLTSPPEPIVVTDILPEEAHHGWRYMAYGPDGMLYVAIGVPCNVCELEDNFGTIARMNTDGSGFEIYATGVRNSVGFDWHPETEELWFTNNGRDWMGDDLPPDTLHYAPEPGLHFGFPYCHAGNIPDPDFGSRRDCDEFEPPAASLTPHGAALGMRFYTGDMFPAEYTEQIFIAERGSWNRTVPIGYRVMLARLDGTDSVTSYEPFAEGWLNDATGQAWGRPVDVQVMPDGALLVSDDSNNAIYRISYTGD
jgi:glucose/arabinose dehydrogenase